MRGKNTAAICVRIEACVWQRESSCLWFFLKIQFHPHPSPAGTNCLSRDVLVATFTSSTGHSHPNWNPCGVSWIGSILCGVCPKLLLGEDLVDPPLLFSMYIYCWRGRGVGEEGGIHFKFKSIPWDKRWVHSVFQLRGQWSCYFAALLCSLCKKQSGGSFFSSSLKAKGDPCAQCLVQTLALLEILHRGSCHACDLVECSAGLWWCWYLSWSTVVQQGAV